MSELNEFDIISKVEVRRLLQEFEEQNSSRNDLLVNEDIRHQEIDEENK